jgi:hypothetical protein
MRRWPRSRGLSATVAAAAGYSSTFSVGENPLGSPWIHTDPTLTVCKSVGGRAFGTQSGSGGTDDSNAYLTGFGLNYEVLAVLYIDPGIGGFGGSHETEILLRWDDTGPLRSTPFGDTHAVGYEINIPSDGHFMSLARFKESGGLQDFNSAIRPGGGVPQSGDTFRARIEGQRIRAWFGNGVSEQLCIDYDDLLIDGGIGAGGPGIGFFISNPAANTNFGFDAVTVTQLP